MTETTLHLSRALDVRLTPAERREAFGWIVDRYQDAAFATAFAVIGEYDSAQDAALEAFADAWRNLPALMAQEAFPGWFRTLVRNRALRHARCWGDQPRSIDDTVPCSQGQANPNRLEGLLESLTPYQREVVVLTHVVGLTRSEAAARLGASPGSIKKTLERAMARLRSETKNMNTEPLRNHLPSTNDGFRKQALLISGRFAELLASRKPILLALDDCINEAGSGKVAAAFRDFRAKVETGEPISDAMKDHSDLFDDYEVQAVRYGEESGTLDRVLRLIAVGKRYGSMDDLKAAIT
jgi:RNA polymerase sigma-70 factor (ECF subfamily)